LAGGVAATPASPVTAVGGFNANTNADTTPTPTKHVEIDQSATVQDRREVLYRMLRCRVRIGGVIVCLSGQRCDSVEVTRKVSVSPDPPKTAAPEEDNEKERHHEHTSPFAGGSTLVRKFGSILAGGPTDGGSRRQHGVGKRGTILGVLTPSLSLGGAGTSSGVDGDGEFDD